MSNHPGAFGFSGIFVATMSGGLEAGISLPMLAMVGGFIVTIAGVVLYVANRFGKLEAQREAERTRNEAQESRIAKLEAQREEGLLRREGDAACMATITTTMKAIASDMADVKHSIDTLPCRTSPSGGCATPR